MSEVGLGFLLALVLTSDAHLVGTDLRGWVPFLLLVLLMLGWVDKVLEEEEGRGRGSKFVFTGGLLGEQGVECKERREGTLLSRRLGRGREDVNLAILPCRFLTPGWVGEDIFLTSWQFRGREDMRVSEGGREVCLGILLLPGSELCHLGKGFLMGTTRV